MICVADVTPGILAILASRPRAGIHALARVDSNSSNSWHSVAQMCHDDDELVRVASVRAVGRMAEPGTTAGKALKPLCFFVWDRFMV